MQAEKTSNLSCIFLEIKELEPFHFANKLASMRFRLGVPFFKAERMFPFNPYNLIGLEPA